MLWCSKREEDSGENYTGVINGCIIEKKDELASTMIEDSPAFLQLQDKYQQELTQDTNLNKAARLAAEQELFLKSNKSDAWKLLWVKANTHALRQWMQQACHLRGPSSSTQWWWWWWRRCNCNSLTSRWVNTWSWRFPSQECCKWMGETTSTTTVASDNQDNNQMLCCTNTFKDPCTYEKTSFSTPRHYKKLPKWAKTDIQKD